MIASNDDAELTAIREQCSKTGNFSWTSRKYQDDILRFIRSNSQSGNCVIEVGCYKGGLTALLAATCRNLNLRLYSMDISADAVSTTKTLLKNLNLTKHAAVEQSTFPEFVSKTSFFRRFSGRAVLCILDGDHSYNAVLADIKAAEALRSQPYALAFHDYSLRHPTTDERVSDAIDDHFGASKTRTLIGQEMNGVGHATKAAPQEDGHWWGVPGSEGAILTLR
ncbi:hypothetical protein Rpal_3906 [Rhodopseudomonas palustris TIE-1]|uniref:class I SAM-dependent methyltransferase n=1 Tax=Rhodopseudomonas palustris TaxID=1076 RepID=UPI0001779803|nr:class I SAM-dependent methyltransferase [Rhodopseudomonas palustris]ACF02404.1 hypothetical protein Rpal_3906 [Rhodopseudomonas palustris TIE-1]